MLLSYWPKSITKGYWDEDDAKIQIRMTKDDKSYDVDDGETGKDDKKNEDEHDDVDGEQRCFFLSRWGQV